MIFSLSNDGIRQFQFSLSLFLSQSLSIVFISEWFSKRANLHIRFQLSVAVCRVLPTYGRMMGLQGWIGMEPGTRVPRAYIRHARRGLIIRESFEFRSGQQCAGVYASAKSQGDFHLRLRKRTLIITMVAGK